MPPPIAQALLEPPDEHPHFHALRSAILVCLVEHNELPVSGSSGVEERAVVWTNEQVLQHGVVGQQDVRWRLPHLVAKNEFVWHAIIRVRRGIAPRIVGILWSLSNVLPERWLEPGCRIAQFLTDHAEPLALIVRQRIHGVEDHCTHPWLLQLPV